MNTKNLKYFARALAVIVFMIPVSFASASELNAIKFVSWGGGYTDQSAPSMQWANRPLVIEAFAEGSSIDNLIHVAGLKDLIKGAGSDKGGDKNNKLYIDLNDVLSVMYSNPNFTNSSGYQMAGFKSLIQGAGSGTKNTGNGVAILDGGLSVSATWSIPKNMAQYGWVSPSAVLN